MRIIRNCIFSLSLVFGDVNTSLYCSPLLSYNEYMILWEKKQILFTMAAAALFFLMAVSLMHAFVPHDHPHDLFTSKFELPVHNVAVEKYFLLLILAGLCALAPLAFPANDFFLTHLLAGRSPAPHDPPLPVYTRLFAKGILHSKAY